VKRVEQVITANRYDCTGHAQEDRPLLAKPDVPKLSSAADVFSPVGWRGCGFDRDRIIDFDFDQLKQVRQVVHRADVEVNQHFDQGQGWMFGKIDDRRPRVVPSTCQAISAQTFKVGEITDPPQDHAK
jgi:hypothetical protein